MEKRVVLFLVLSLGIIFGYDLLLKQLGYSPFSTGPVLDQPITPSKSPTEPEVGSPSLRHRHPHRFILHLLPMSPSSLKKS
jgi:YidC/Oxa1 family membrane protein insertase